MVLVQCGTRYGSATIPHSTPQLDHPGGSPRSNIGLQNIWNFHPVLQHLQQQKRALLVLRALRALQLLTITTTNNKQKHGIVCINKC